MRFWVPEHVGGLPGGAIWEANTDGSGAHRLLPGWQEQPSQVAGSWSPDGRYYVFGVHARRREDLWLLPERRGWFLYRRPVPVQLTRGPLTFHAPLAFSPDGQTLFAVGEQLHGELMRSDPATHQAVPYLSGISATEEAFSPDGQWITYVTIPDFSLWRSRTDGSDPVQLTSLTGYAGVARWSPDGRRIAFEWAASGKTLKLAVISRDGGAPEQVIPDNEASHDQNDPRGRQMESEMRASPEICESGGSRAHGTSARGPANEKGDTGSRIRGVVQPALVPGWALPGGASHRFRAVSICSISRSRCGRPGSRQMGATLDGTCGRRTAGTSILRPSRPTTLNTGVLALGIKRR